MADPDEAIAWYESHDHRAAARFRQEVNAAFDRIVAMPESYPLSDWRHRLCLIASPNTSLCIDTIRTKTRWSSLAWRTANGIPRSGRPVA